MFCQALERQILRAEIAASLLLSNSNTMRSDFLRLLEEFNAKRKSSCEKVIQHEKEYKLALIEERKAKERLEKMKKKEQKTAMDVAKQSVEGQSTQDE